MYVKHLQEYLDEFTDGKKGTAVSNARIFMESNGYLEEIRRIEVQESSIIGSSSIRVVLKPMKEQLLINPEPKE
jgi:hypothetical protein|tara:strand:+ start:1128 stop:1349 length:222 start_codon:yes stop_codon:yes gene_type:complete